MDIQQSNDGEFRELALFAGAGGGILGGLLLGWKTICAVERDIYAASVLAQRQNDGFLDPFPIWSDVSSFDGKPWRGRVDVISGGFPCQDISCAGKGEGIDGERSGLWSEFARIIREIRSPFVFVENSPMLTSRGLHRILGDLADMGYNAEWGVLGAKHTGAIHKRNRIWILATNIQITDTMRGDKKMGRNVPGSWWKSEPVARNVARSAESEPWILGADHGLASVVDRLKCAGNGQHSICAAMAWSILIERIEETQRQLRLF